MTPDSTKPGMHPRSRLFHPASISSIQALPNNSIAKYSIRCDAIPRSTDGNFSQYTRLVNQSVWVLSLPVITKFPTINSFRSRERRFSPQRKARWQRAEWKLYSLTTCLIKSRTKANSDFFFLIFRTRFVWKGVSGLLFYYSESVGLIWPEKRR